MDYQDALVLPALPRTDKVQLEKQESQHETTFDPHELALLCSDLVFSATAVELP